MNSTQEKPKKPTTSTIPDKELNKDALLLIQAIQKEIELGTKHYNKAGVLLHNVGDVIGCMLDEGSVRVEPVTERTQEFTEMAKAVGEA